MRALLEQANHKLYPRDLLALERTMLGNTRTVLSIIRTALAMLAVGAGFLRFLEHTFFHILAHVLIASSVIVFILGLVNYYFYRRSIAKIMIRQIETSLMDSTDTQQQ